MIDIPGYEFKREIGANKMASVYVAMQTSLDREVAIKVMAPAFADDPAFTQRFMQEARTLASLAHPHIVAVYDVGLAPDKRQYFSMQYLPGGDFNARVAKGLNEAQLIETLEGVAQALDYVHQRGLIHRDVTPSNILFDLSDAPILTDFGIARAVGPSAGSTSTDFSALTGHYMSPEQARGASLDARADLYSLGALTWFGLTGKPPYDGPDGFAVAYAHVFEPIPRLPAAQSRWQPLIDRALAKEPGQRFATAREFLDALNKLAQMPRSAVASAPDVAVAPTVPPLAVEVAKSAAAVEDAFATLQRPLPAVAASTVASPATKAAPPAAASASATIVRPLPATEKVARAPSGASRVWPVFAVIAGLAVIGTAVYLQYARRPADGSAPKAVAAGRETANTPAASVIPPAPAPVPTAPADTSATTATANTAAPAVPGTGPSSPATAPVAAAPSSDATAIASLDAAAEAAVGEYEPVTDLAKLPTVVDPVIEAVRWGRIALAGQRLTTPPGNNALEYFQFAVKKDPKNSKNAKQGIVDIAKKYLEYADKNQGSGDLAAYLNFLTNADDVAKTLDEGADVRKDVESRRAKAAEPYLAQAKSAATEWDKVTAKAAYEKVLSIDPSNAAAREGLKFVANIGEPGFVFHDRIGDAGQGPELIVLGGKIAAARRDVTRGEFRRYWNAAGKTAFAGKEPSCRDRESFFRSSKDRSWQSPGFDQDDSHPVVCVSWPEAAGYAQWLSRETGKRYRLLGTAEFDRIAAGAGSDCASANLADATFNRKFESRDGASCDDGFAGTSPVGHYEASGGVFDASGNVRVWVAACGSGAPVPAGGCRDYLAKGRSWLSPPKEPATKSDSFGADVALNSVGFRLVRELDK